MASTATIAPNVRAALDEFRDGIRRLYGERLVRLILYGSRARGDARPESDVDVLVVLRGPVDVGEEIARTSFLTQEINLETGLLVSSVFLSEGAFETERSPLLSNVRREGIAW